MPGTINRTRAKSGTTNRTAYAHASRCPVLASRVLLSAYVPAMHCPVLTSRILLPASRYRAGHGPSFPTKRLAPSEQIDPRP
eukprot:93435-Rhodomonas_salina.1